MQLKTKWVFGKMKVELLEVSWVITLALVTLAMTVSPLKADNDSLTSTMDSLTVRIVTDPSSKQGATGSGFLIGDGSLVVTNVHVIAGAKQEIFVLQGEKSSTGTRAVNKSLADVLHFSENKDIAILKLRTPFSKKGASLNLKHNLVERQKVCVVGFPGAADRGQDLAQMVEPKFSDGIISAFITLETGVHTIQTDAAVNPGNSGGPLFNECGQVIGIVVQKSLAMVASIDANGAVSTERVPVGEGIGWAILVDELVPELQTAAIMAPIIDRRCLDANSGDASIKPLLFIAILLALTALVFAFTRKGRHMIKDITALATHRTDLLAPVGGAEPMLRGLAGPFKGESIPLNTGTLVLGRDPTQCQIVVNEGSDRVSKRHCSLKVDGRNLVLEDHFSTNGTFIQPGERMRPGESYTLRRGSIFYLGDQRIMFEIK